MVYGASQEQTYDNSNQKKAQNIQVKSHLTATRKHHGAAFSSTDLDFKKGSTSKLDLMDRTKNAQINKMPKIVKTNTGITIKPQSQTHRKYENNLPKIEAPAKETNMRISIGEDEANKQAYMNNRKSI